MIIIVDSDGLIGISQEDDAHHLESTKISQLLARGHAKMIFPATTIAEATAILQIRLNKKYTADKIIDWLKSGIIDVEAIDQQILTEAAFILSKERNKHVTLFDAIVATVAKKYKADAIFSFDKFYKKLGFKLAADL